MYTFKENISEQEFESFVASFSTAPIQQTLAWGKLKNNWQSVLCGLYKDDRLCGAALILIRKLLPGFSCAYCPRGPLTDLNAPEAVQAFAQGMKDLCKKHGVYEITVDPLLPVGLTLPDLDEKAYFNPYNTADSQAAFDALVAAGFRHGGFGKELHATLQPRFNAMIPLRTADGTKLTAAQLKKNYRTKIRSYFGAFRQLRGLYFEKAEPTEENLKLFESILQQTEQRQNISLRGGNYFKLLTESFGEDACLAFEKCYIPDYLKTLRERLQKEPENEEKLREQLADAEKVMAEHGETVTLAATLTVFPPNRDGVRIAEYLYAGSDLRIFPAFSATLCALYDLCQLSIEKDCHFLNLGGFAGTFDDGLFTFKNHFNPLCTEYAGEFTLVINPLKYNLMTKAMPLLKKVYKAIFGKK